MVQKSAMRPRESYKMKRSFPVLLSIFFTGCTVFGIRTVEQARYTVMLEDGAIQIRQYENFIVAETTVEGQYKESGNMAFKRLAAYIFGENKGDETISMTAPVLQEKESGEKISMTAPVLQEKVGTSWNMSFVMPAKYTMDTLPEPIDPKVTLKEIQGKKVAAITYRGLLSEENISKKLNELEEWLHKKGYTVISEPRSAGYDPPWTIPFLRRNEVHIDIE
jgi:DNA gyrase inhibitor GyrI